MTESNGINQDDAVECEECGETVHKDDSYDLGDSYQCTPCSLGEEASRRNALEFIDLCVEMEYPEHLNF